MFDTRTLPALAQAAPTTDFLLELGNGLLVRLIVAEILNQLTDALDDLEPGDLERIAYLARAARARQNDVSELPLFAIKEG